MKFEALLKLLALDTAISLRNRNDMIIYVDNDRTYTVEDIAYKYIRACSVCRVLDIKTHIRIEPDNTRTPVLVITLDCDF